MQITGMEIARPSWRIAGLAVVAIAAVGYLLYGTAEALRAHPQLPEVDSSNCAIPAPTEIMPISPMSHFAAIQERNLFKAARPEVMENADIENLPVMQLGVKLLGTIYCDVAPFSRAIILEGDKQRLVKVGDSLNGHPISEIRRRAVVFDESGEKKVLLIELEDETQSGDMWGGI